MIEFVNFHLTEPLVRVRPAGLLRRALQSHTWTGVAIPQINAGDRCAREMEALRLLPAPGFAKCGLGGLR